MCACAGVVVDKVMTCGIVETRLVLAVINIGVALFPSVTRLAGAEEITNKVCTRGVVVTGIGFALVDFCRKEKEKEEVFV